MPTFDLPGTPRASTRPPPQDIFPLPRLPFPAVLAPHSDTRGQLTYTTPAESPYLDLPGYLRHLRGHTITLSQTERDLQAALVLETQTTTDARESVEKLRRKVVGFQALCDRRAGNLDGYYRLVTGACERLGGWMDARRGVGNYRELDRMDGGYMGMLLRELRQMKGEIRAEMERDRAMQMSW